MLQKQGITVRPKSPKVGLNGEFFPCLVILKTKLPFALYDYILLIVALVVGKLCNPVSSLRLLLLEPASCDFSQP